MFYPTADIDYPDMNLLILSKLKKCISKGIKFGKNVLKLEKMLTIGKNSQLLVVIAIIESNVQIGKNCVIGSFVIIKNSLIRINVLYSRWSKNRYKRLWFYTK